VGWPRIEYRGSNDANFKGPPVRFVVPAATVSKSMKAFAKKSAPAKAKSSKSPSAGKGSTKKARRPATLPKSKGDGGKGERSTATKSKGLLVAAKPTLLAGGNPQIAKADGDAPVQAFIAAMPGWKRDVGRRLDALIVRNVPEVRKAVRWNSPFYGVEGQGWFLGFHVFTRYVKVTFFRGTSLRPVPPGASKHKEVRYLDIHEDDLDEAQIATWVKQAAAIPGWDGGSPRLYGGIAL
jgi:hypothetical protein